MYRENANYANNDNNYAFAMQHNVFSKTMYKWIMDSWVTKYMTSHRMDMPHAR